MTLLILAAGMGSRYGGLKQLDPITKNGEFIIDFSVYDAVKSGFDKIVFVIKEENLELFRNTIGKRFEDKVKVEYAFQRLEDLPNGYSVPEGRTKPWGTTQAVLSTKNVINEPFAVINADDFYGRGAFELLAKHLKSASESEYCMVGYILKNTLTENGTVSRGACKVENGYLESIEEMTKISRVGDVAVCNTDDGDVELSLDTIVSMNCWGFTPDIFEKLEKSFADFLAEKGGELKSECYLPMSVGEFMADGKCTVNVYPCSDKWYGVTYQEDREGVVASLSSLIDNGTYPDKLNENI
jgi:UTP-glucose-1-phosphate uridylyltransferase